jgi:hypothetical protein
MTALIMDAIFRDYFAVFLYQFTILINVIPHKDNLPAGFKQSTALLLEQLSVKIMKRLRDRDEVYA